MGGRRRKGEKITIIGGGSLHLNFGIIIYRNCTSLFSKANNQLELITNNSFIPLPKMHMFSIHLIAMMLLPKKHIQNTA